MRINKDMKKLVILLILLAAAGAAAWFISVSYTHLTLPTILLV